MRKNGFAIGEFILSVFRSFKLFYAFNGIIVSFLLDKNAEHEKDDQDNSNSNKSVNANIYFA